MINIPYIPIYKSQQAKNYLIFDPFKNFIPFFDYFYHSITFYIFVVERVPFISSPKDEF